MLVMPNLQAGMPLALARNHVFRHFRQRGNLASLSPWRRRLRVPASAGMTSGK